MGWGRALALALSRAAEEPGGLTEPTLCSPAMLAPILIGSRKSERRDQDRMILAFLFQSCGN